MVSIFIGGRKMEKNIKPSDCKLIAVQEHVPDDPEDFEQNGFSSTTYYLYEPKDEIYRLCEEFTVNGHRHYHFFERITNDNHEPLTLAEFTKLAEANNIKLRL